MTMAPSILRLPATPRSSPPLKISAISRLPKSARRSCATIRRWRISSSSRSRWRRSRCSRWSMRWPAGRFRRGRHNWRYCSETGSGDKPPAPVSHNSMVNRARVLTTGHGGCTFTLRQPRRGAIPDAGGTADADGARAQARNLSAFCCADLRPLHRTVAEPHRRPGAVERVLGVGIARGQHLVDVDAEPRFVIRPHHAVMKLWSSREDLPADVIEAMRLLDAEVGDGEVEMEVRRMPDGRDVSRSMPRRAYAEELTHGGQLASGRDAADRGRVEPDEV